MPKLISLMRAGLACALSLLAVVASVLTQTAVAVDKCFAPINIDTQVYKKIYFSPEVIFADNKFVVADRNYILQSDTGASWTVNKFKPMQNRPFEDISTLTWNGNDFIAGGIAGRLFVSQDLDSWDQHVVGGYNRRARNLIYKLAWINNKLTVIPHVWSSLTDEMMRWGKDGDLAYRNSACADKQILGDGLFLLIGGGPGTLERSGAIHVASDILWTGKEYLLLTNKDMYKSADATG